MSTTDTIEANVWYVARRWCGCAVACASDSPESDDFIDRYHGKHGYTVERVEGNPKLDHCRCGCVSA